MLLYPLYSDHQLLVVSKPTGIPTQPDFEEQCRSWLMEKRGKNFLHVAHRIDTPVSGIVVCGCSSKALSRLSQSLREGDCKKEYLAVVTGNMVCQEGVLEHFLFHDMERRIALVVRAGMAHARKARLSYRLLMSEKGKHLLAISLETGRYHQIRAQFAAIGCPVLGDTKYGSTFPCAGGGIALHHFRISFPHPSQPVTCEVTAPFPHWLRGWPSFSSSSSTILLPSPPSSSG